MLDIVTAGLVLQNLKRRLNQVTALGNIFSSLHFIPSQHPNFYISPNQISNRFRNLILQTIENCCRTDHIHILFEIGYEFIEGFLSILSRQLRNFSSKLSILLFWNGLHGYEKSPQSNSGKFLQFPIQIQSWVFRKPALNNWVCPFHIHFDYPSLISDYHWHSLPIWIEGKNLQQLKFGLTTVNIKNWFGLGCFDELIFHVFGSIHQSYFIGGRTLINFMPFFIDICHNLMG